MSATFYLGTDNPKWLGEMDVPLFVSRRRLATRKTFPRARSPWALDSGGFTELAMNGTWTISARQYVDEVRRIRDEVGNLEWAAPQDWMCEPSMLAKTGLTVAHHQTMTVHNFVTLRDLAPELPIVPVLQGWTLDDYLVCADLYAVSGVDLTRERRVGVGSVCRRNSDEQIGRIIRRISALGIRCHAFGVKSSTFARLAHVLASADSMAWSYTARNAGYALPGCSHRRCNHCQRFALRWRERTLSGIHPELDLG